MKKMNTPTLQEDVNVALIGGIVGNDSGYSSVQIYWHNEKLKVESADILYINMHGIDRIIFLLTQYQRRGTY